MAQLVASYRYAGDPEEQRQGEHVGVIVDSHQVRGCHRPETTGTMTGGGVAFRLDHANQKLQKINSVPFQIEFTVTV